jgi:hypothetical protein
VEKGSGVLYSVDVNKLESTRGSFLAQLFRHLEKGGADVGSFSGATARPIEVYMEGRRQAFKEAALLVELAYKGNYQFAEDCIPDIAGPVNAMLRSLMCAVGARVDEEQRLKERVDS